MAAAILVILLEVAAAIRHHEGRGEGCEEKECLKDLHDDFWMMVESEGDLECCCCCCCCIDDVIESE